MCMHAHFIMEVTLDIHYGRKQGMQHGAIFQRLCLTISLEASIKQNNESSIDK